MLREHWKFLKRLHFAVDLSATSACFVGSYWWLDPATRQLRLGDLLFSPTVIIPVCFIAIALATSEQMYHYRFRRLGEISSTLFRRWLIAGALTICVGFAQPLWLPNRPEFFVGAAATLLTLISIHAVVWSALWLYRKGGRSFKNVLIVGTGKPAQIITDNILAHPGQGLHILGFLDWDIDRRLRRFRDIPVIGTLADLPKMAKNQQLDMVIFAVGYRTLGRVAGTIGLCSRLGIPTTVITDILGDLPVRQSPGEFFGKPGVQLDTSPTHGWKTSAKTVADRFMAAIALVLSLPVFAVVAAMIKIDSEGPVFFRQMRVGLNGRRFTLYKFRTMVDGAEQNQAALAELNEMSGPVFKITNDPRITRLGRFLRRTSIDELPQLWNILKGEMSLVGPRPPLPAEVVNYDGWERRRLSVKPGLTCLWQIGGRNKVDFDEWMKLDLEYIDSWSLKKDAEILVKTIPTVLRGTGAR